MKTQKMANGSSHNSNKLFSCLTDGSDIDPSYKLFLERLSEAGDHGMPASVRYEEDDMSYEDGTDVPNTLPHRSQRDPNVQRPGQTSANRNKLFSCLTDGSDVDHSYKLFLERLSEAGDHGMPASVRYEEDELSYEDGTNVPNTLPHRSQCDPTVERSGQTSASDVNANVDHSVLSRISYVKKNSSEIDESYAAFLSLLKIKDGFMVIEPELGGRVVYEQEETPTGYDEWRTVISTKSQEDLLNALGNMGEENVMLRNEDRLGQTDNIISEHGINGPAQDNFHSQDLISTDEHGLAPYTESSDFNVCEDYQGSPLAFSCRAPFTFDEKLDCVLSRPYDQTEYEELLRKATDRKPVSRQRNLRNVSKHYPTEVLGLSYLDHYPDLDTQIDSAGTDEGRLNLLRKFFFWLENLSHEGAHMPWIPKALSCDPIVADDYE